MTLWVGGPRPVDRNPVAVDDRPPPEASRGRLWMTASTRWTPKAVPTSEDPVFPTIHMPYYRSCKNYLPFRKDPV
jgi:hypothetical protein